MSSPHWFLAATVLYCCLAQSTEPKVALALGEQPTNSSTGEPAIVELKIGFLVGRQRQPWDRTYARPGRQMMPVFNYGLDRINQLFSSVVDTSASANDNHNDNDNDNDNHNHNHNHNQGPETVPASLSGPGFESSSSGGGQRNHLEPTRPQIGGIKFTPVIGETFGDEGESIKRTIELISRHQVDVIIGPQESCQIEPKLASIFNVPMISYYCSQQQPLAGPSLAAGTFVQTKPPHWKIVQRVVTLVGKLIDSYNAYPNQVVLLYFKEAASVASEPDGPAARGPAWDRYASLQWLNGTTSGALFVGNGQLGGNGSSSSSSSSSYSGHRNGANATGLQLAEPHRRPTIGSKAGRRPPVRMEHSGRQPDPSRASNEAIQYKLIGELLELQLGQLFALKSRQAEAPTATTTTTDPERPQATGAGAGTNESRRTHSSDDGQLDKASGEEAKVHQAPLINWPQAGQLGAHSLTVLNWHTTFHYGYTKNPFRAIIRRHLFQRPKVDALLRPPTGGANQRLGSSSAGRASLINGDKLGSGQRLATGRADTEPPGQRRLAASGAASGSVSQLDSDAIYIVVGHYYEHLGLMLSLDELGLLGGHNGLRPKPASDSPPSATAGPRDQPPGTSNQQQEGPQVRRLRRQQQRRRRRRRRPGGSVVIGVDIEPYDERDDSVRFLRGLLMDSGRGSGSSPGPADPGHQQPVQTTNTAANRAQHEEPDGARADINSVASLYDRYIGIVPSKPARSGELLDDMRQFYNRTNNWDDHTQTNSPAGQHPNEASPRVPADSLNRGSQADPMVVPFSSRLIQFIRLPVEAFYLYDSIQLIGAYFNECLLQHQLKPADCGSGRRMFDWFVGRKYSSYIDENNARFDWAARAEGSYTILARRQSALADQDPANNDDGGFGLMPVGRFVQSAPTATPATVGNLNDLYDEQLDIQLDTELEEIDQQVWLPFWCFSQLKSLDPKGSRGKQLEVCDAFFASQLSHEDDNDEQQRWPSADGQNDQLGAANDWSRKRAASLGFSLATFCLISLLLAASIYLCHARNASGRLGCLGLECLGAGGAAAPNGAWFDVHDESNFLQIVQSLLLTPEALSSCDITTTTTTTTNDNNSINHHQGAERESPAPASAATRLLPIQLARSGVSLSSLSGHIGGQDGASLGCHHARLDNSAGAPVNGGTDEDVQQRETLQQLSNGTTKFIDLHCYMFPFPSCKFVHWLIAMLKLKELLFKYQASLQSQPLKGGPNDWLGQRLGCRRASAGIGAATRPAVSINNPKYLTRFVCWRPWANISAARQRRIRMDAPESGAVGARSRIDGPNCGPGRPASNYGAGDDEDSNGNNNIMSNSDSNNNNSSSNNNNNCDTTTSIPRDHATTWRNPFFLEHHKATPTLRLLLNKYKSLNKCLCQLSQLDHETLVKLQGVTLSYSEPANFGPQAYGQQTKLARLLLLWPSNRGNLRQALNGAPMVSGNNASQAIKAIDADQKRFRLLLTNSLLKDLLDGLNYLHASSIGFHGELRATTCLLTPDWRLKLSGFHVKHMRLSLGCYELKHLKTNQQLAPVDIGNPEEADQLVYSAPEVLLNANQCNSGLSVANWRLADLYSFAFILYELIVGQEPWQCLTGRPKASNLLVERIRADQDFRPPMERLNESVAHFYGSVIDDTVAAPNDEMHRQYQCTNYSRSHCSRLPINLEALRQLLASCWSHLPQQRPKSVGNLRRQLEQIITGLSNCRPSNGSLVANFYANLLERAATKCGQESISKSRKISHLRMALLPKNLADSGPQLAVEQFNLVSLCAFRFKMIISDHEQRNANLSHQLGLNFFKQLNEILRQLDELINSYHGQIHLLDSQADSMLRYLAYAGEPLHRRSAPASSGASTNKRARKQAATNDPYNQARVLASFALELIDLANRFEGSLQIKCALHCGSVGAGIVPGSMDTFGDGDGGAALVANDDSVASRCGTLSLSRYVLMGLALQVVDALEQTSQAQRIQISANYHEQLRQNSLPMEPSPTIGASGGSSRTPAEASNSDTGNDGLASIMSIISLNVNSSRWSGQQSQSQPQPQQAYIIIKRGTKIPKSLGHDLDTYWLLNGPRLTASQKLMLSADGPAR